MSSVPTEMARLPFANSSRGNAASTLHESGRVYAVDLPVPQCRDADCEGADVAIEESFSLPSFPSPSATGIKELA
jgi:hypothetical protein